MQQTLDLHERRPRRGRAPRMRGRWSRKPIDSPGFYECANSRAHYLVLVVEQDGELVALDPDCHEGLKLSLLNMDWHRPYRAYAKVTSNS